MIEKGDLIVVEIAMGRGPISLVLVNARISPILESHTDAGIIPILEGRVDSETVHVHMSMPTMV